MAKIKDRSEYFAFMETARPAFLEETHENLFTSRSAFLSEMGGVSAPVLGLERQNKV